MLPGALRAHCSAVCFSVSSADRCRGVCTPCPQMMSCSSITNSPCCAGHADCIWCVYCMVSSHVGEVECMACPFCVRSGSVVSGIHTVCCVSCGGSFGDCVLHHQECSMPLLDISSAICQFMPLFRYFFSYLSVYAFVQIFLQLFVSLCLCSDISSVICQLYVPLFRHFFSYLSVVLAFVRPDISIIVMVDWA